MQRVDDAVADRRALRAGELVRRPQRVHAGAEQRLVGVDVPDAGDAALVEQERLDRRARGLGERVQVLAGEVALERLDAEAGVEEGVERLRAERELAGAEAARVVEDEHVVAEVEPHPHVPRRRGRVEQERAGHAQVHEQEDVVGELPDEVLAAAGELLDDAALDRRGQLGRRERPGPARVEHLHGLERASFDVGRQMAADRLDFGELGHRPIRLDSRAARSARER